MIISPPAPPNCTQPVPFALTCASYFFPYSPLPTLHPSPEPLSFTHSAPLAFALPHNTFSNPMLFLQGHAQDEHTSKPALGIDSSHSSRTITIARNEYKLKVNSCAQASHKYNHNHNAAKSQPIHHQTPILSTLQLLLNPRHRRPGNPSPTFASNTGPTTTRSSDQPGPGHGRRRGSLRGRPSPGSRPLGRGQGGQAVPSHPPRGGWYWYTRYPRGVLGGWGTFGGGTRLGG